MMMATIAWYRIGEAKFGRVIRVVDVVRLRSTCRVKYVPGVAHASTRSRVCAARLVDAFASFMEKRRSQ